MLGALSEYVRPVLSKMTVEPVVAMFCLIIALSGIHSMEICDNIHDHQEAQTETQKLVSGVQVSP